MLVVLLLTISIVFYIPIILYYFIFSLCLYIFHLYNYNLCVTGFIIFLFVKLTRFSSVYNESCVFVILLGD